MELGIIALLPAVLVIVLSLLTRRVTEPLFAGCVFTYLIIAIVNKTNPIALIVDSFFKVATDYDTVWVIVISAVLNALIAIMVAAHSTHAIAKLLEKMCKTQRSTLLVSWLLGIIIFIDDYLNILTITACTKEISDKRKIPRESLAYVVDSTGAPMCVLLPFSSWVVFFAGVFFQHQEVANLGYGSAMSTYIHTIPYMFYAFAAVIVVPLFIFGVIPKMGAMKKAYRRVEEGGLVYSDASKKYNSGNSDNSSGDVRKAKIWDFLFPMLILIVVELVSGDLFVAAIAATVSVALLYLPRKLIKPGEFFDAWMNGIEKTTPVFVIMIAALWMKQASDDINLPMTVINFVKPFVSAGIYPMITFIAVALLGFITGSNWGIPALCTPIFIPLGAAIGANLLPVMAAVVCGGVFSSHACFYSDSTVLTSIACGVENLDHGYSQLPYALIAAGLASIAFFVVGFVV